MKRLFLIAWQLTCVCGHLKSVEVHEDYDVGEYSIHSVFKLGDRGQARFKNK